MRIMLMSVIALIGLFAFRANIADSATLFCSVRVTPGILTVQWVIPSDTKERFVDEAELLALKGVTEGFTLKAVTKANNFIEIDYATRTYHSLAGLLGKCQSVDAEVKIGFQQIEVLFLKDLLSNECLLNEIREHEMAHVHMYLNNGQEAKSLVRSVLGWIEEPAIYSLGEIDNEAIQQRMRNEIKPKLSLIFQRINARQETFDSPREYSRLSSVCK